MSSHERSALSDTSHSHTRHHEYSYRLPSPPRIVIPPPTLATEMPDLDIGRVAETENGELDMSFLGHIDLENIIQRNSLLEWSYERRRQAHMILPFLYLGPMIAAKDKAFLHNEGITMVLSIRSNAKAMSGALQAAQDAGVDVATLEIPLYQSLVSNFPRTTQLINRHLAKVNRVAEMSPNMPRMGKVLVFCESGNEKSAAVVAAYLMEVLDDFDYMKAMQVCQAQRFCVNFDDTIKHLLQSYWDILQAKRLVAKARPATALPNGNLHPDQSNRFNAALNTNGKHKRTIDDTFDEDMDMDEGVGFSDGQRFSGRDVTPFQDSRS